MTVVGARERKKLHGSVRSGTLIHVESSEYLNEGDGVAFGPEDVTLEQLIIGRHYSVKAPQGWAEVSGTPVLKALLVSSSAANVDIVCADVTHQGRFAPTCVVTDQPVDVGAEGEWIDLSTRALLDGIPGFVMLDMGEAVDAPEGNVLLLGTYICDGESLTSMQCLWIDPAPTDYRSEQVGVALTLTCATRDFPRCGEVLVRIMSSCDRLAGRDA